jgi:hypothetical protein
MKYIKSSIPNIIFSRKQKLYVDHSHFLFVKKYGLLYVFWVDASFLCGRAIMGSISFYLFVAYYTGRLLSYIIFCALAKGPSTRAISCLVRFLAKGGLLLNLGSTSNDMRLQTVVMCK